AKRASLESGIPVELETVGEPFSLGGENERSLLLLVREAVLNALRHAGPTHVSIRLMFHGDSLALEVEDDGCGFDPAQVNTSGNHHYGIIGMRERVAKLGGEFVLTSEPGKGTVVRLKVGSWGGL